MKSSTVTAREMPINATSFEGGVAVRTETLTVQTAERVEFIDITDQVAAFVRHSRVRDGLLTLWSAHTTCSVFINETQAALHADIKRFLEIAVSRDADWEHNDPERSDCDRVNADSHLRSMLLGHGLTLQVSGGEVVLGQWQRILVGEFDGPRARTIRVQAMGV